MIKIDKKKPRSLPEWLGLMKRDAWEGVGYARSGRV